MRIDHADKKTKKNAGEGEGGFIEPRIPNHQSRLH